MADKTDGVLAAVEDVYGTSSEPCPVGCPSCRIQAAIRAMSGDV